MAASTFGGCFGDVACLCGPLETQGRGSLHPHMLITLIGHDLVERLVGRAQRLARQDLVAELQRWSDSVLHAASRLRFDCQNFLAEILDESPIPLPLRQKQKIEAGRQYADVAEADVERDGHEASSNDNDILTCENNRLTGCYSSLRPSYIRRQDSLLWLWLLWSLLLLLMLSMRLLLSDVFCYGCQDQMYRNHVSSP